MCKILTRLQIDLQKDKAARHQLRRSLEFCSLFCGTYLQVTQDSCKRGTLKLRAVLRSQFSGLEIVVFTSSQQYPHSNLSGIPTLSMDSIDSDEATSMRLETLHTYLASIERDLPGYLKGSMG